MKSEERILDIIQGDCLAVIKDVPDASISAVVTDPPYELGFMGKGWDQSGIAFNPAVWKECLRVLKPGGHLLAFGGTRTYHRIACAIEDAGFEIRDCMMWLYGSGFPKSLDISKAVDKAAGAEREVVGQKVYADGTTGHWGESDKYAQDKHTKGLTAGKPKVETAPATDAAKKWSGWGTALKPAWEPIILAMKLLDGTFAENAQQWGVAGLNVDGCRVEGRERTDYGLATAKRTQGSTYSKPTESADFDASKGRWPANLILDEQAGAMLDGQTGECRSSGVYKNVGQGKGRGATSFESKKPTGTMYADSGGASRFFYCAKASAADRFFWCRACKAVAGQKDADAHKDHERNAHPTVKPMELMRYLVRLVCPPDGVILDPFAGTGTTIVAAKSEGFHGIGIEQDAEYAEIGKARLWA